MTEGLADPNLQASVLIWLMIVFAVMLALFGLFGYILFKAGRLEHPAPLVVSLSLLTAVALIGGMVAESVEALTLAATGLGALAGSLSSVYTRRATSAPSATGETQDGAEGSSGPAG